MNTISKIILTAVFVAVGLLLNNYVQPLVDGTSVTWFPLSYLMVIPFCFFLTSIPEGKKSKYSPMKRFVVVTIAIVGYIFISELFNMDRITGKLVASLCGALIMYLILLIKPSVRI